jgi:hypothetical protein
MVRPGARGRTVITLFVAAIGLSACGVSAAEPQPIPPRTAEPRCAVADQLFDQGLLTQAGEKYASGLPSASPRSSGQSGSLATDCAVTGLARVAKQRQKAAVLAAQGDTARLNDREKAHSLYEKALEWDRGNTAAAAGRQELDTQPANSVGDLESRWSEFITTTAAPLGRMLLWLLVGVVVIYVITRWEMPPMESGL